jgi:hypothetical protein
MSDNNDNGNKERLIILETKFEILTTTLRDAVERLERKLDYREENYVTKPMLELELKQRDKEIETLKESKKDNKYILPTWIGAAISLVAVIVTIYTVIKG